MELSYGQARSDCPPPPSPPSQCFCICPMMHWSLRATTDAVQLTKLHQHSCVNPPPPSQKKNLVSFVLFFFKTKPKHPASRAQRELCGCYLSRVKHIRSPDYALIVTTGSPESCRRDPRSSALWRKCCEQTTINITAVGYPPPPFNRISRNI